MNEKKSFGLQEFWPYLLNQAAEATSLEFQKHYKNKYGMLRTEWRVLFHLGRYGPLTAKSICERATLHKTKVSRAVSALENRRFITRETLQQDRRHELLALTKTGTSAFNELIAEAQGYNQRLTNSFTRDDVATFERILISLAKKSEVN